MLAIDGLRVGDRLILTKALGTGVALAADMRGRLAGRHALPLTASLIRDNRAARDVVLAANASACTDVSGFGLAGHLLEMLSASGVGAELELAALPVLPGALDLLVSELRSSFHDQNAHCREQVAFGRSCGPLSEARRELLFDPQTSGGLLFALPPAGVAAAIDQLHHAGDTSAAVIGTVVATLDRTTARIRCVDDSAGVNSLPA